MGSARKIIHVDADSFYASVEMREDPSLVGKPLAVGGRSERRGVIAAASYAAREYGVRSAMASSRAMTLCPQLIILPPRFELYREISAEFHSIFSDYTSKIEPLSLDEAYLDVTDCERCDGSATLIAREIRQRIKDELRLTVSAGVAPNKFLAKVASDWDKPDGLFTIAPDQVAEFVRDLPVNRINGVGKVTAAKLAKMGVQTCGDLQALSLEQLVRRFGKYGKRLADVARGKDERPVQSTRTRKSISVERTFADDIADMEEMITAVDALVVELKRRFGRIADQYAPIKRVIKIKYKDFNQTTFEEMLTIDGTPWDEAEAFRRLLASAWPRGAKPVRLLGVGLRLRPLGGDEAGQLPLFASPEPDQY